MNNRQISRRGLLAGAALARCRVAGAPRPPGLDRGGGALPQLRG